MSDTNKPLGLLAAERGIPDGEPLAVGSGRALKGRVVVTDPERQRALFPPPSPETIARIKALEARVRRF